VCELIIGLLIMTRPIGGYWYYYYYYYYYYQVDNRTTPTDESSRSSIWLRRVQGRDEVSRTGSGRLINRDSKQSTHSSTIIKGRANKVHTP